MMKQILAVLGSAAVATTGVGAATATPAPPTTRVVVIPGQTVGTMPFGPMKQNLESRGYPTTLLNLPGENLRAEAAVVARTVDGIRRQHPGDKIALVTESIGGITGRVYLKEMGGTSKVATYIAIGTAQYGSPVSCAQPIARENCPGSPFLKKLNAGDDTPGPTKYFSIRSAREWSDGRLDGGQCRVTPIPANESLPVTGMEHTFEPFDARVWNAIVSSLRGHCAGKFVTDPDGVLTAGKSTMPGAPGYHPGMR
ncbi:lipase [Gordonia sp. X0973]|uniref:lipase family alpha/beta hydrolase n=1 Tax=Gordonia sp. X0973 TaxID=2742602 RepID=UPI000F528B25|nr:lipase [Gordonia sp. X0973]QKT07095.1 lipase [Gordonia sp. X0973]